MNELVAVFKALGDLSRLRITAALLVFEELCACQIIELLGFTGATVSRHLSILVQAGLLETRKDGRWVYYRLNRHTHFPSVIELLAEESLRIPELHADIQVLKAIAATDTNEICRRQRGEKCC